MKRRLIIVSVFLLSSIIASAQIAFYDAEKLVPFAKISTLDVDQTKAVAAILANYMPKGTPNDAVAIIAAFKANNGFAKGLFNTSVTRGDKAVSMPESVGGDLMSAIGGIDVTKFATGLAEFMINRSKQELTIAFFDRFKEFGKKNPEFGALFPITYNNLSNLLAYQYPEMLPALRSGFFEDIKALTYHLDDLLALPKYQALLKDLPEVAVVVRYIALMHDMESGAKGAATVLENIAAFPEWDQIKNSNKSAGCKNFGAALTLANVFSGSLRAKQTPEDTTSAWVTEKEVNAMLEDETRFKIYLALVLQDTRKKDVVFFNGSDRMPFADMMNKQSDNAIILYTQVKEFITLAKKVDVAFADFKRKESEKVKITNEDHSNYISVAIDVMDYSLGIAKLFDDRIPVDSYTKIATSVNNLYKSIYTKQYSQAMSNAITVLEEIPGLIGTAESDRQLRMTDSLLTVLGAAKKIDRNEISQLKEKHLNLVDSLIEVYRVERVNRAKTSVAGSAELMTIDNVLSSLKRVKTLYAFKKNYSDVLFRIARYGMFMANVVNATSSEEVAKLIESTVLPVGSSSIKKNSAFNISVQGYLGAFLRLEKGKDKTVGGAWNDQFGVTAPIGISLNWGLKNNCGSLGIFAALFDIGAIVDYQLKRDSVPSSGTSDEAVIKKDYSVKLGQIVSPGLYLVYGAFKNIPLSLGIGGQYGPGLGKVNVDNTTVVNSPSWRWNAFLCVDIPFFTLTNNNRSKK
ncbi:hypothetical protein [Chitinophaga pinensis]|uniref:Uncharacterized protein n=1 Tax=Chitinophaga pinensis (strain ATCC 43595 / DSM 2588 / LMG 13176 / NBRC 15968 / NCIMB 11800 / UQM 2034) TaxID=485918 RepID=A0A979G5B5_CHIPD|nr:hypothetical protein [Chitinophaga pinensis]ACU60902.1 hypothetical protein Cpin_3435 [Chitinophaga pinensis DSM 2588]